MRCPDPSRRPPTALHLEALEERVVPTMATDAYANVMANLAKPAASGNLAVTTGTLAPVRLTGDFNGDGVQDIATFNPRGSWTVALSSRGQFTTATWQDRWAASANWLILVAGDFDGDGKTDVAGLHDSGEWWVGLSTGSAFVNERWDSGWTAGKWLTLQAGDFNGDGKTDVAGLDASGQWHFGLSNGSAFTDTVPDQHWSNGNVWTQFLTGDFDDDGRTDIAALHKSGEWWVARLGPDGFHSERWMAKWVATTNWATLLVGDFDGDGKDDIAGFYNNGVWFVAHSTGTSFETEVWQRKWSAGVRWQGFVAGDFDGDGKTDVAGLHVSGEWWVGHSDGTGFVSERWATPLPARVTAILPAADYNADGNADVAALDAAGNLDVGAGTGTSFAFGTPTPGEVDFIAPWHVNAIRLDPGNFGSIFGRYETAFRKELGPAFAALTEDGLALAFAGVLAYELASYRGFADPEGTFPQPDLLDLGSLLSVPKLVCNEYAFLTDMLYRTWMPRTDGDPVHIVMAGWSGGQFGDHAQVLVTGAGMPLMIDPTTGLIAATDLAGLLAGTPLPAAAVAEPSVRVESTPYMEGSLTRFRNAILDALHQGLYPQSAALYQIDIDDYIRDNAGG